MAYAQLAPTDFLISPICQVVPKIPVMPADTYRARTVLPDRGGSETAPEFPSISSIAPRVLRGHGERSHETQHPFATRLAADAWVCGGLWRLCGLPDDHRRTDAAVGLLPEGRPAVLPAGTGIQTVPPGPGT